MPATRFRLGSRGLCRAAQTAEGTPTSARRRLEDLGWCLAPDAPVRATVICKERRATRRGPLCGRAHGGGVCQCPRAATLLSQSPWGLREKGRRHQRIAPTPRMSRRDSSTVQALPSAVWTSLIKQVGWAAWGVCKTGVLPRAQGAPSDRAGQICGATPAFRQRALGRSGNTGTFRILC